MHTQTMRRSAQEPQATFPDAHAAAGIEVLLVGLLLLPLSVTAAEPGDLDPSFDKDGVVITGHPGTEENALAVALQQDGKIVAAGHFIDPSSDGFPRFTLARYRRNGRLDPTFGSDGRVITEFGPGFLGSATAVAVQPNGKIIAAGNAAEVDIEGFARIADPSAGARSGFALVRYLSDGSPDPSFGDNGIVVTDRLNANAIHAMALQPDGKIVVAGYAFSSSTNVALARYLSNGRLDRTFGDHGVVVSNFADAGFRVAKAIALQPDGKIVVAGTGVDSTIGATDFALARYHANGALDTSFGSDGIVLTDAGGINDGVSALAVQADGKIVAAGPVYVVDYDFAVVRYNPDGTLDSAFDGDGRAIADLGANEFLGAHDIINSMLLQPDGKIVAAGSQDLFIGFGQRNLALARFQTNGAVDTTFGGEGYLSIEVGSGGFAYASAIVLQPDGKIVTAGSAHDSEGSSDFALTRFHAMLDDDGNTEVDRVADANDY